MSAFPILDESSAPAGSRPVLSATRKSLGFVPNLFGVMAHSPALLEAYTTLSAIQDRSDAFDETERQVLFLSISAHNGCGYCVAAHSTIADMKQVPADVVAALRDGTALPTPRLEALRHFAVAVVDTRGWPSDDDAAAFRAAGFGDRHVLEVILAVAFKTLSNFTNHAAGTAIDPAFAPQAWESGELLS